MEVFQKEQYYISVTEHQLYKSNDNLCQVDYIIIYNNFLLLGLKDAPDYDFQACIRTSIATKVGCRPLWDDWSPKSFNICQNISQINIVEMIEWFLMYSDQNQIISKTGCLVPCTYREFQIVGEPRIASNTIYGQQMKKG